MIATRALDWRRWRAGWGILALALLITLVANVVVTHHVLTEPYPGHNDFMSRWEGARSYWREGLDPYGETASANIQRQIYGRMAATGEDPGYFAYPFYTVFLLWPLVYLPYAWASAIWMVTLEVCLVAALVLQLDLYRWRPRPWLMAALLFWTVAQYFAARGLFLGQVGLVVYLLQILALWGLARKHDLLAGVALALSTIKPQMGFLLVPFLVLLGIVLRRYRFIAFFAVTLGGLIGASFLLLPAWLGEWVEQLRRYPSYTAIGAPVWIITQYYLGLGALGEWGANVLLWAVLGWAWYRVLWRGQKSWLDWTVMLTLTITHLSAVRTATPHYVIFTLPFLFYLKRLSSQRKHGNQWVVAILASLLVLPWAHFVLTVQGRFEHPTVYLPVPFGMLLLLWFTRHDWWQTPSLWLSASAE
ncbi:MAG: glycosyltransferase family 87 protein [Aggregatilineaceae bacterium]